MAFAFQRKPRREDQFAAMTVWANLQDLAAYIDTFFAKFKAGTTAVAATSTTVVVTHGLGQAAYRIAITPTVDPTTRYWISNKTSTQFQINLAAAAPGGGVPFDWMVKGD